MDFFIQSAGSTDPSSCSCIQSKTGFPTCKTPKEKKCRLEEAFECFLRCFGSQAPRGRSDPPQDSTWRKTALPPQRLRLGGIPLRRSDNKPEAPPPRQASVPAAVFWIRSKRKTPRPSSRRCVRRVLSVLPGRKAIRRAPK